jgi:hypothetical protein
MNRCGWCGQEIFGEPEFSGGIASMSFGDSFGREFEVITETPLDFCCEGCKWAFELDLHRIIGMTGKEAREHIRAEHKLSPGKPGGKQSKECWDRSAKIASAVFSMFTGFKETS